MQPAAVDLVGGNDADDDPLGAADDAAIELVALVGRNLLRVVQVRERPDAVLAQARVVEQHTGDDERPGERAPPGLVGSGDEARAELAVELEELLAGPAHAPDDSAAGRRAPVTNQCNLRFVNQGAVGTRSNHDGRHVEAYSPGGAPRASIVAPGSSATAERLTDVSGTAATLIASASCALTVERKANGSAQHEVELLLCRIRLVVLRDQLVSRVARDEQVRAERASTRSSAAADASRRPRRGRSGSRRGGEPRSAAITSRRRPLPGLRPRRPVVFGVGGRLVELLGRGDGLVDLFGLDGFGLLGLSGSAATGSATAFVRSCRISRMRAFLPTRPRR